MLKLNIGLVSVIVVDPLFCTCSIGWFCVLLEYWIAGWLVFWMAPLWVFSIVCSWLSCTGGSLYVRVGNRLYSIGWFCVWLGYWMVGWLVFWLVPLSIAYGWLFCTGGWLYVKGGNLLYSIGWLGACTVAHCFKDPQIWKKPHISAKKKDNDMKLSGYDCWGLTRSSMTSWLTLSSMSPVRNPQCPPSTPLLDPLFLKNF